MLTGMFISQPRWCHCSVMEELSNSGSSSKWRFSMATARAPPFSAVPQICKGQAKISACVSGSSHVLAGGEESSHVGSSVDWPLSVATVHAFSAPFLISTYGQDITRA
jgi:hypothetical protein